ncbi:DUF3127 domain-containing protein [Lutibacter sp. A64]|uniref:DUF3127 domain-containing protein n=1 Tax=Lutibacter sp. A64 TaxID=2918526 RepID=UPI001F06CFE2|nr:DUF3127 domain-containing protein [Lutibacter sp. A64]UMB52620.1 DUF3127 domain-containing protein [Lutibacter sp. A64]
MEKQIIGTIKKIDDTKTFGANGFRKRELVVITNEQYAQLLLIEFIQDKCDLLDAYEVGQEIKISINLKGREWVNPEGEAKYFNSIQGWAIEKIGEDIVEPIEVGNTFIENEPDDLPF